MKVHQYALGSGRSHSIDLYRIDESVGLNDFASAASAAAAADVLPPQSRSENTHNLDLDLLQQNEEFLKEFFATQNGAGQQRSVGAPCPPPQEGSQVDPLKVNGTRSSVPAAAAAARGQRERARVVA